MSVTIREFQNKDAEACAAIIEQNKDHLGDLYSAEGLIKAAGYTHYFVAESEGKIAGIIGVSDLQNGIAMGGTLCVDEKAKGKGIGTLLLRKIKEYCKENNFRKLLILTHEKNKPMMILAIKEDFIPEGALREHFRDGKKAVVYLSYFME